MTKTSFITPGHVRAYHMLTSSLYEDNLTLTSCWIDGEPGVAIALVERIAEDKVSVMPLFVAVTSKMNLEFVGGQEAGGDSDEGGGPREVDPDTLRMFVANKSSLEPR